MLLWGEQQKNKEKAGERPGFGEIRGVHLIWTFWILPSSLALKTITLVMLQLSFNCKSTVITFRFLVGLLWS